MKVVRQHPKAGHHKGLPDFIEMESKPDADPKDDAESETPKTPEDAVKKLTPVPAQEKISPPLSATMGGDDVVIPVGKH